MRIKGNFAHIAFAVASTGITCTTLGHYADIWVSGFIVAFFFSIAAMVIFGELSE